MTMSSTAEAPSSPDLRERRQQIVWYLRATVSTDEAEAMASPGYKPTPPCGACGRKLCRWCDTDPAEQVQGSRGGKRSSADPKHVRSVVARFGQFPRPVLVRTYRSLAQLPPLERLVLLLHDGAGIDQEDVARHLKVSRSTVHRARERALDALVGMIWQPGQS